MTHSTHYRSSIWWAKFPSHGEDTPRCNLGAFPMLSELTHCLLARSWNFFHGGRWFCPTGKTSWGTHWSICPKCPQHFGSHRDNRSGIAYWVTLMMVKVLKTSTNCSRWAFASSLAFPHNGLACTMVIRPVFNSKFTSPMSTADPISTLAIESRALAECFLGHWLEARWYRNLRFSRLERHLGRGDTRSVPSLHRFWILDEVCVGSNLDKHYPVFIQRKQRKGLSY